MWMNDTPKVIGPDNLVCPLHKKPMSEVCHKCPLWQPLEMEVKHPVTGVKLTNQWACALAWAPTINLMTGQRIERMSSEVEKLANESEAHRKSILSLIMQLARVPQPRAVIDVTPEEPPRGERLSDNRS